MKTQIQITKCVHVTPTERKHLEVFFQSGQTEAKINTKYYTILSGTPISDGYQYRVRIATKKRNDHWDVYFDMQTIEVTVKK